MKFSLVPYNATNDQLELECNMNVITESKAAHIDFIAARKWIKKYLKKRIQARAELESQGTDEIKVGRQTLLFSFELIPEETVEAKPGHTKKQSLKIEFSIEAK